VKIDFKFKVYDELCEVMVKSNYQVLTLSDFFDSDFTTSKYLILRHDVDRNPENSLVMARIEHEYGLKSTYYFRTRKNIFNKAIIKQIYDLGHEIGYHYECLADSGGNFIKALNLFEADIESFKDININLKTLSMHGSPLSSFDNREMWSKYNYYDYGFKGEAYEDVNFSDFFYFTDTGSNYSGAMGNMRDKPRENFKTDDTVVSTFDLINFLTNNKEPVYINVHPDRWSHTNTGAFLQRLTDFSKNIGKYFLKKVRR